MRSSMTGVLRRAWGASRLQRRLPETLPAPIAVAASGTFDGNDGPWSTFSINIGTPPQNVKVLISTASSQTWAVLPEGCTPKDPTNCTTARGGAFQPNGSSTWHQNQDASGGLFPLTLETQLNVSGTGLYGCDTVALNGQGTNGPSLDGQVVAGVATKAYYLGLFGLNPQSATLPDTTAPLPDYLSQLNQSGQIPSLSWGYTGGNQYRSGSPLGSLTLGGYDASRFLPNEISFPFNGTDSREFRVNIGQIVLVTNDTVTVLGTQNESISAAIDSTTPYFILPLNVCEQFEEAFGIAWDDNVQGYLVNKTLHDTLSSQNTSVTLNLGDASTVPGEGFNITLPYAAFNLTASAPLLNTPSRYFPLMRAANDTQITLGRTFLQEAYLIADFEHNNFSVSQCNWEAGAAPQIAAIQRPGTRTTIAPVGKRHLSGGAIAGIVVGIVVFAILACGVGFWYVRKHRTKPKDKQEEDDEKEEPRELAAGPDPYAWKAGDDNKHLPQSPELGGDPHKGHELDSSPHPDRRISEVETPRYELDASLPISPLSPELGTDSPPQHQT